MTNEQLALFLKHYAMQVAVMADTIDTLLPKGPDNKSHIAADMMDNLAREMKRDVNVLMNGTFPYEEVR